MACSIIWSTMWVGISPMPSSQKARQAIIKLLENTGTGSIYELGSGWGNLLIPMAQKFPHRKIIGYELSLLPWLVTKLLIKILGLQNIQLYRKNFMAADLSNASVLVCYLYPEAMQRLSSKLTTVNELPTFLISNNFALPRHTAVKTIHINDFYHSPVYFYKIRSTKLR
jgi:hypothetical protein